MVRALVDYSLLSLPKPLLSAPLNAHHRSPAAASGGTGIHPRSSICGRVGALGTLLCNSQEAIVNFRQFLRFSSLQAQAAPVDQNWPYVDALHCPAERDKVVQPLSIYSAKGRHHPDPRLTDSEPGRLKGQAASNSGRGAHPRQAGRKVGRAPALATLCRPPGPKSPQRMLAHPGPFGPHLQVLQARRGRQPGEAEGRVGQAPFPVLRPPLSFPYLLAY